jgi:anthraniloyl-CoA monooxygenase
VKIACIGGGPAGLYLGILAKLASPRHAVTVYERNRADDTFGFGVVFSDATLGHLAAADPQSYDAIAKGFARWDDIEVQVGGEVLRSTGHGFAGIERKQLLQILQHRAAELGVDVQYERDVRLDEVADADVVVAADGVASGIRTQLADHFHPSVDLRPNRFVWLGTTVPYRAFTFIFKESPHGLYRVHAYRYSETGSTFIVECTEETWKKAGFIDTDEDRTIAILERVFEKELAGHKLIKNRSIWRNFPTVRNRTWRHGNVVLVGDAAHTAHFSIGSGTKLAMEDCIALRDALVAEPDVDAALATYEMKRRPEVEALQAAAQASLEWFEGTERYLRMTPVQMTYSLMTRSLRVSHASVQRRDPPLARAVEELLARSAGVDAAAPPPPMFVPAVIGGMRVANRIALAPWRIGEAEGGVVGDKHLVFLGGRASGGVGVVMTETIAAAPGGDDAPSGSPRLGSDDQTVAWRRVVEFVHGGSPAKIGAQIAAFGGIGADLVVDLASAAQRAGFAGFDLLVIHLAAGLLGRSTSHDARTIVIDAISRTRDIWPADRPLGVRVVDPGGRGTPKERDAILSLLQDLQVRGVQLAWVAPGDAGAVVLDTRTTVAPLSDRIRNELGLATVIEGVPALPADLDALVAAGRCDLCALDRPLVVDPGFVHRAAEAVGWTPS